MHVHTRVERARARAASGAHLLALARAREVYACSVSIWRKVSALLLTRKTASLPMAVVAVRLASRIMRFTLARGSTLPAGSSSARALPKSAATFLSSPPSNQRVSGGSAGESSSAELSADARNMGGECGGSAPRAQAEKQENQEHSIYGQ